MFSIFKKLKRTKEKVYSVTEGIESHWNYHISSSDQTTQALCGKPTMGTNIPLNVWGQTPEDYHIPETWCKKCESIHSETLT